MNSLIILKYSNKTKSVDKKGKINFFVLTESDSLHCRISFVYR